MAGSQPADFKPRPAALDFGKRYSAKLFEGRTGHGGGPCSYRNLRPAELAALLALAFEAGIRSAPSIQAQEPA